MQSNDEASAPVLTVGANGGVAAVWQRGVKLIDEAATRPLGGAWSVEPFTTRIAAGAGFPIVGVAGAGTVTAVWSNVNLGFAARRPAAGPWPDQETTLTAPRFGRSQGVSVAASAGGDTFVAWYAQSEIGPYHLQGAVYSAAGGWSVGQDLGQTIPKPSATRTLVDEQGNGTVIWTDDSGTVRARTYDNGPPVINGLSIPGTATTGEAAAFSAAPMDRWTPTTTTWDFGDGAKAAGAQASHAYAAAGTYTVRITTADGLGDTATALTFVLDGPLRPSGKPGQGTLGTASFPAGAFAHEPSVSAATAAKLLPGTYTVRATGPEVAAAWTVKVAAPKEGVILTKRTLAKGTWTAELVAGKTVVDTISIRVG